MTRTLLLLALFIPTLATAAPLQLPKTAIPEDTWFVATIDLAKASPSAFESTMKAALAEKADDATPLLEHYKKYHELLLAKGAQTVTVVFHGDPNAQREPEPSFYVHFKPNSDQTDAETAIREAAGEQVSKAMQFSSDGEFMVVRPQGVTSPEAGSETRTATFTEALAASDKPIVAALIFTDGMVESFKKEIAHGAPQAILDFMTDSKLVRIELSMGENPKADVTIKAADEDGAKRVADAVNGFASYMNAQIAQMKQILANQPAGGGLPPDFNSMIDGMTAFAEALKPTQTGDKVTLTASDKAVGGVLRSWFLARHAQTQAAPNKGGL